MRRALVASAAAALALPLLASPTRADDTGTFVGTDGVTYPSAPPAVPGRRGDKFYGTDFDVACGRGPSVSTDYRSLARLARVIERSGRRVVWTVAPSKTTVLPRRLPAAPPHGRCDQDGFADVRRALDDLGRPQALMASSFLPLRTALDREPRQTYFKTDLHWTSVGGSVFARELARHLDPSVARVQRYEYGNETRLGNLNWFAGDPTLETAETALPSGPVRTRTARDSRSQWTGYPALTYDYAWRSRPDRHTVPGRTLVVGDSFTMFALDNLLPLFRRGRFVWVGQVPDRRLVAAIRAADTVVLEAAQVFIPLRTTLSDPALLRAVRRALADGRG